MALNDLYGSLEVTNTGYCLNVADEQITIIKSVKFEFCKNNEQITIKNSVKSEFGQNNTILGTDKDREPAAHWEDTRSENNTTGP